MKLDVRRSRAPFKQLLYVEWILLGMAALATLSAMALFPGQKVAWGELSLILGLTVMGLHLPQRWLPKLSYTVLELSGLLLLALHTWRSSTMTPLLPLLGMVVVIRSCQMLQGWWRVAVVGIVFTLHGIAVFARGEMPIPPLVVQRLGTPPTDWQMTAIKTNLIIFFGLVLVFVLLLVNALLSVYRSQQDLAIAHEQLRAYAAKIENQATLQERNRIAREIHDSLGHALTAQTILLENALLFLPPEAARAKGYLTTATESAYQALRDVSKSVATLRTQPLQDAPLSQTIPALVKDICQPAHIVPDYLIELPEALPEDTSLALLRIVQEALTNTVKHSQAQLVQVRLVEKSRRLNLQVLDNGKGFDPSKNTSGFGLRGMRERATALGGTCQIWSAPGAGCRIRVILPLPASLTHPA
ncbi:MAG: sensor histidine kinase [Leptolyngbya sp. SIOISBB]|nr:sensor histidine kinase [Leptolyngbya sp. SIOISBB]